MTFIKRFIIIALIAAGGYFFTQWLLQQRKSGTGGGELLTNPTSISAIDSEMRTLVLLQSYILEGTYTASKTEANNDGTTLGYSRAIDRLIQTDIKVLLDQSTDKNATLSSYIKESDELVSGAEVHILELDQQRQTVAFNQQRCAQQKSLADTTFFRGLENEDTDTLEQGLRESKENGACEVELRIEYNALGALIAKLKKKSSLLKEKSNLLFANQDLIINNYANFSDQQLTLESLLSIRAQLERIERANRLLE